MPTIPVSGIVTNAAWPRQLCREIWYSNIAHGTLCAHGSLNRSLSLGHVVADRLLVIYLMVGYRPQTQEKVRRKHRHSWSHGRYHDVTGKRRRLHHAAAQVSFATVNSPCLGDHISSDTWRFTDASHYMCTGNEPTFPPKVRTEFGPTRVR